MVSYWTGSVTVRQNVLCRVWRQQFAYCLHFLLGASRMSVRSAAVHCAHGGHCKSARCILNAFADDIQIHVLSSRRPAFCCHSAGTVSLRLASWWPPIASNSTQRRLSWYGPDPRPVFSDKVIVFCHYNSGHDSIAPSDHVRLLGATISSDLSVDWHVANVSSTGFKLVMWAPTQPAFTGHGLGHNTGPRIRIVTCWLLQHFVGKCAESGHWQVAMGTECCCSYGLQYPQVRPRFVVAPALGASLARCAWKSSVSTQCRNVQLFAWPSTAVPHRSAQQCPTSQHGSIFDLLLGISLWFQNASLAHLVHGHSLWPTRRFGTLYQTAREIWILAGTA